MTPSPGRDSGTPPSRRRRTRRRGTEHATRAPSRWRSGSEPGDTVGRADGESEGPSLVDIQVNRLRVLDRLADDLAHEVKNPLNAVVINLELLKRRIAAGETGDALERADRVGAEVQRVHELVDALFQVMRPDCDAGRSVDVDRVLRDLLPLIELQAKLARVALDRRPARRLARVAVRPFTLKQAVLNLVAGAIDAAPGGRLELHTGLDEETVELSIRSDAPRDALLAQDDRWSAVRALVRDGGGRVDLRATDGGGSELALRLPRDGSDQTR